MTVKRDKIIKYLNKYLKVSDFKDYCVNGLQIEGRENISKVIIETVANQMHFS